MELNRTEFLLCTETNSQRASETQVYHTLHQEDSLSDRADWPLPPLEIGGARGGVQLGRLGHVSLKNITLICINNQGVSVRGIFDSSFQSSSSFCPRFFQGCWWWCRSVSHVDLPHSQAHFYEQVTEGLHAHRFRGRADWAERRKHQVESFFLSSYALFFSLQSGDSVKRQPKSQCLSALVTPTFREVGHTVAFYTISDSFRQNVVVGIFAWQLKGHWGPKTRASDVRLPNQTRSIT